MIKASGLRIEVQDFMGSLILGASMREAIVAGHREQVVMGV